MRRKITIITALCMLVGAGAAFAAGLNNYTGTTQTFDKVVGSKKKPVAIGFKQTLAANNDNSGKAAAPLIDIKTRIYGLVSNGKNLPTCSGAKMVTKKSDKFCPAKSKVASGLVHSKLGDPSLLNATRVACNPNLDVFNAGKNKLTFFFTTSTPTQCAGLTTGQTAPYPGFIKQQGKYQVTDVPLPPDISTKVAGQSNLYGSLIKETLTWAKFANKSIGCLHGKRPWSIAFTATDGHTKETKTVTGSAKC